LDSIRLAGAFGYRHFGQPFPETQPKAPQHLLLLLLIFITLAATLFAA
jgi:hypothetical protein